MIIMIIIFSDVYNYDYEWCINGIILHTYIYKAYIICRWLNYITLHISFHIITHWCIYIFLFFHTLCVLFSTPPFHSSTRRTGGCPRPSVGSLGQLVLKLKYANGNLDRTKKLIQHWWVHSHVITNIACTTPSLLFRWPLFCLSLCLLTRCMARCCSVQSRVQA